MKRLVISLLVAIVAMGLCSCDNSVEKSNLARIANKAAAMNQQQARKYLTGLDFYEQYDDCYYRGGCQAIEFNYTSTGQLDYMIAAQYFDNADDTFDEFFEWEKVIIAGISGGEYEATIIGMNGEEHDFDGTPEQHRNNFIKIAHNIIIKKIGFYWQDNRSDHTIEVYARKNGDEYQLAYYDER